MTAESTSSVISRPGRWRLRFVLLGGGLAWTLHLLGAYVIAEFGVLSGLARQSWVAGLDAVSWLLIGWSVLMFAMAAAAVAFARTLPRNRIGREHDPLRFCARFGFAANATFLAVIAVQCIPIFYFLGP